MFLPVHSPPVNPSMMHESADRLNYHTHLPVGNDWKPAEVKKEPAKEAAGKGKENKEPEKPAEDGEKSGTGIFHFFSTLWNRIQWYPVLFWICESALGFRVIISVRKFKHSK
jgi:hypothetical protein